MGPSAFVCGHPIAHSRSPMIHGHWLKTYGISGSYEKLDVAPTDFPAFIRAMSAEGWAGGNVTIPHKEAAYALVGRRDEAAEIIGAVNTLWFDDGTLVGGNTDALGFARNLDDLTPEWKQSRSALVLGAGGAARAVVHALKQADIRDIRIANRTVERARELADRFGAGVTAHGIEGMRDLLSDADLLINTTALGMEGHGDLPADPGLLPAHAIVGDIVYVPLMTPLLQAAAARGLTVADGLGMLLHQAAPGFGRWFGVTPAVTPDLRALIVADIERHT